MIDNNRTIDMTPVHKFTYCQIHNKAFNFFLVEEGKMVHSWFECKDYLQDIFWSEYQEQYISVHGLQWGPGKLKNLNPKGGRFELGLHGGGVALKPLAGRLEEVLRQFDKAQGFKESEVEVTADPKVVVVHFSKEWTLNGPLLSAFTTIIRLFPHFNEGEDVVEGLHRLRGKYLTLDKEDGVYRANVDGEEFSTPLLAFTRVEMARFSTTYRKLLGLMEGKKVEMTWKDSGEGYEVHNLGVVGCTTFPMGEGR